MEKLVAYGRFHVLCYDKDGNLKWEEKNDNLVVNVGLQYMAGVALTSTAPITTWYIGLWGAGASNAPAAGDTMASHAGWTEFTGYSNANRVSPTFTAATLGSGSSVVTNATAAAFNINASGTVGGAFLTSGSGKGGTTGTLFSGSDFTGGDRSVVNLDTLNVIYTFTLSG